jgi:hypothetical protein
MVNMTYMQPLTGCNNNGSNGQNCRGRKGDSIIEIPCHFLIRGHEGNIEILKNKKRLEKSSYYHQMFKKNLTLGYKISSISLSENFFH